MYYSTEDIEAQKATVEIAKAEYLRLKSIWETANQWEKFWNNHKREMNEAQTYYETQQTILLDMIAVNASEESMYQVDEIVGNDQLNTVAGSTFSIIPIVLVAAGLIAFMVWYFKKKKA